MDLSKQRADFAGPNRGPNFAAGRAQVGPVAGNEPIFERARPPYPLNYARPHGALGGQTPYERLRRKMTQGVSRPRQSHNSWWVARESNPEPTD
jgi:hypothetical protein